MSFSRSDASEALSSSPAAAATGSSALSQKVLPSTAACETSWRSNGSSASRRAASRPCTVSGSSIVVAAVPSSAIRCTISSANSGFPPQRSASALSCSLIAPEASSSSRISSCASAGASGSRKVTVAVRRIVLHPGRRPNSSSRARHTCSTGARSHRER